MKGQEKNAKGTQTNRGESRGRGQIVLCFDEIETKLLFRLVRYALGLSVVDLDMIEQDQGEALRERMREFLWSLDVQRDRERRAGGHAGS